MQFRQPPAYHPQLSVHKHGDRGHGWPSGVVLQGTGMAMAHLLWPAPKLTRPLSRWSRGVISGVYVTEATMITT